VHRYPGTGALRTVYLVILATHTVLAAIVVPLVLRTIYLASHARLPEHRRIARWTLPIWFYVSVTGVVVYAMLYHPLSR
jgi:putative membrane protein